MYLIDGCVSSQLIKYVCKSVQSSFDNSSIKAKMVGKRSPFTDQTRSNIKNNYMLDIQAKDIFNEKIVFMGTMNFLFHLSHSCVRNFKVVCKCMYSVRKIATLPKMVKKVKALIATDARFITKYITKCIWYLCRSR
jgi:hypothetical protein